MKAVDILKKLKTVGFQVSADDRDILLDGNAVLSDNLRQDIQANKPEILFHLRTREYARLREQALALSAWIDDSSLPLKERQARLPEYDSLVERIGELQEHVDHYRESGLDRWCREGWILIHSELLNELIIVIRNSEIQAPDGYPVYEFREVKMLEGKSDQQIRQAHAVKKAFEGEIVEPTKKQRSKKGVSP